jgi:hypothetical protein
MYSRYRTLDTLNSTFRLPTSESDVNQEKQGTELEWSGFSPTIVGCDWGLIGIISK